MLSFIIIPKEQLFNELPDLEISELPEKWGLKNKGETQLRLLIRRLRNAVAHGNISVTESLLFTFADINPKKESDKFTFSFEEHELRNFVHAFAWWIITKQVA